MLLDFSAHTIFLLLQLGREFGAEITRFEQLANLDLEILMSGIGAALDPFDRFFLGFHLPDPEAGDQLLGLGERAIDHGLLASGELDARALRTRKEALAGKH